MYAYIILLVLALLFLFGTALDSTRSNPIEITKTENQNSFELFDGDYDSTYETNYKDKNEMLVSSFSGNIVPMAILVFVGLFAGAYHKNKFEKNIIGLIGKRQRLVFSNLAICSIYCLIIIMGTLLVSIIGYYIFYTDFAVIPLGSLSDLISFLATYYVLLISVAMVMSCFVQLVGNQIIAIIVGLIYGSGLVYGMIDVILQALGVQNFSVKEYVPLGILYSLSINEQSTYWKAILVAIIFGVCSVMIHIYVRNRQDIAS